MHIKRKIKKALQKSIWKFGFAPLSLLANPSGESVVNGSVNFERSSNIVNIQASHGAIIHYDSFNIAPGETVRFIQPDANSKVLNRVLSQNPSQIDGSLFANGQVYIVNPVGVFFGKQSIVNTAGLFAIAGNISDSDFLNNTMQFTQLTGSVINHGEITANDVFLAGQQVNNCGAIVATEGTCIIKTPDEWIIGDVTGSLIARLPLDTEKAGIENTGSIQAKKVVIGAGDIYRLAVRNKGSIVAKNVTVESKGDVYIHGSVDASNLNNGEKGGSITITGDRIGIFGATLDVSGDHGGGSVRIGGDYLGGGELAHSQVTAFGTDSKIFANAITDGDGGQVILWSDDTTHFGGEIYAKGGLNSGNGGFVETSSKDSLNAPCGLVDTTSPRGNIGTWLLDPGTITLVDGAGDSTVALCSSFSTGGATPSLSINLINTNGAAVTLQALTTITSTGAGPISLPFPLTMEAGGTIDLSSLTGSPPISAASITLRANATGGTSTPGANIIVPAMTSTGAIICSLDNGGTGTVTLNGNVIAPTGLTITGAMAVGNSLTITNSSGLCSFSGAVALNNNNLTVNASSFSVGGNIDTTTANNGNVSITTSGTASIRSIGQLRNVNAITINNTGTASLNGSFNANGAISVGPTLLLAVHNSTSSTSSITYGTIQTGGFQFTATAASTVNIGALVTSSANTGNVILTGPTGVTVNSIGTVNMPINQFQTSSAVGLTTLAGSIYANSNILIDDCTLNNDITVQSTTSNITFSTVQLNDNDLIVNTGTNVTFGNILTQTLNVGSINVTQVTGATFSTIGTLSIPVSSITVQGSATVGVTGNFYANQNIIIPTTSYTGDYTLRSTSGNLNLTSVNLGNHDLTYIASTMNIGTITSSNGGSVSITTTTLALGNVGQGGNAIQTLNVTNSGIATLSGSIKTINATGFSGPVQIANDLLIEGQGISIGGAITQSGSRTLTLSSVQTINLVGAITLNGLIVSSSDNLTCSGLVTVNNLSLNANPTTTIAFNAGLNVATSFTTTAGNYNITIPFGTITPQTTFTNTASVNLGTTGQTVAFTNGVNTTSATTTNVAGTVTSAATKNIVFGATATGSTATVNAGGNLTISTLSSAGQTFNASGTAVTFTGSVTVDIFNITGQALTMSGGANVIDGSNPTTFSTQSSVSLINSQNYNFNGGLIIPTASVTLTAVINTSGSNIQFGGPTNIDIFGIFDSGTGDISLQAVTANGSPASIQVSGENVTLNGPIGTSSANVSSIQITSNTSTSITDDIYAVGNLIINGNGNVSLSGDLNCTGNSNVIEINSPAVNLSGATRNFTTNSGDINLNCTIDGASNLVLSAGPSGTININNIIGGTQPLTRLTANSGALTNINTSSITCDGTSMIFNTPVVLLVNTTLTDTGPILFNSTLDGLFNLTISTPTSVIVFNDAVGGISPLNNLTIQNVYSLSALSTVTASSILQQAGGGNTDFSGDVTTITTGPGGDVNITTTGNITFSGTVSTIPNDIGELGGDVILTSSNGSVTVTDVFTSGSASSGVGGNAGNITLYPSATLVTGSLGSGDNRPVGIINLNGNLTANGGTGATPGLGGTILLGSGRSAVPSVATIASAVSNDVIISGATVNIGVQEVTTVLGNFTINATTQTTLSDINAKNSLSIISPSITLTLHPFGNTVLSNNTLAANLGAHYVSNGGINFSSVPISAGSGDPAVFYSASSTFSPSLSTYTQETIPIIPNSNFFLSSTVLDIAPQSIFIVTSTQIFNFAQIYSLFQDPQEIFVPWNYYMQYNLVYEND